MPERINTTAATGESAVWSPAADDIVQVDGAENSAAIVELYARVDAAAPWAYVAAVRVSSDAFIAVKKMSALKLVWHGNKEGDPLMAWSA